MGLERALIRAEANTGRHGPKGSFGRHGLSAGTRGPTAEDRGSKVRGVLRRKVHTCLARHASLVALFDGGGPSVGVLSVFGIKLRAVSKSPHLPRPARLVCCTFRGWRRAGQYCAQCEQPALAQASYRRGDSPSASATRASAFWCPSTPESPAPMVLTATWVAPASSQRRAC